MEIYVAVSQPPVHVLGAGRLFKQILSGFERTTPVKVVPENKCFFAADNARALQFRSDSPGGVSRMQHDEGLPGGGNGG